MAEDKQKFIEKTALDWKNNSRWKNVNRPYTAEDVWRLRGSSSFVEEYKFPKFISNKFWELLHKESYINALGCETTGQAVQCAKAGLRSIYCSGWVCAAGNNLSLETYPDQGLYPSNSVPTLVKRINKALQRASQIDFVENKNDVCYELPIVADAESGFGGSLNTFEIIKQMIEAGASLTHLEDQSSMSRRCGHAGGKILIPTSEFIQKLIAARLATDVMDVPMLIMARTDSKSATYLTSDVDEIDRKFIKNSKRTKDGFYQIKSGVEMSIERGLAYAEFSDMLWMEDSIPSLDNAKKFAEAIHSSYPDKLLALNCSPSFNWKKHLSDCEITEFQNELAKIGYNYFFITLSGWHISNNSMFELARGYKSKQMKAYTDIQEREFENEKYGFTAVRHQRESAMGYYDLVSKTIGSFDVALENSTEHEQFNNNH